MTSNTPDHRTRVGAERRQRMLAQLADAALRVMAEQGPENTSVDAIIQAAGVSRGTFYKYHEAPSDLIRAVGAALARDLIDGMAPDLDRVDDPALRLTVAVRSALQMAKEAPVLAKFLIRAGWPATDQVPAFSARAADNLSVGIRQGRFRQMPLAIAMAAVGGVLVGALAAQLAPDASPELESEATVTLLLGLGVSLGDAKALANLPMSPSRIPVGGILSRSGRDAG